MKVSNISVERDADCCTLRAVINCDTEWVNEGKPFHLWFRYPATCASFIEAANSDPFVPALLAPAMVIGEDLEIDGQVSAQLLAKVPRIQTILQCWENKLSPIRVSTQRRKRSAAHNSKRGRGLFFSLGVDSCYSLQKDLDAGGDLDTLIVIEGCDMYLWESARFPALLARVQRVADSLGKQVIHVTTNLRDFSDQLADWVKIYYGSALAATALGLGQRLARVHIAAAQTYSCLIPSGAHPLLDPLWNTEKLEFIHDGLEAERLDKIRVIARNRFLSPICASVQPTTKGMFIIAENARSVFEL